MPLVEKLFIVIEIELSFVKQGFYRRSFRFALCFLYVSALEITFIS